MTTSLEIKQDTVHQTVFVADLFQPIICWPYYGRYLAGSDMKPGVCQLSPTDREDLLRNNDDWECEPGRLAANYPNSLTGMRPRGS